MAYAQKLVIITTENDETKSFVFENSTFFFIFFISFKVGQF